MTVQEAKANVRRFVTPHISKRILDAYDAIDDLENAVRLDVVERLYKVCDKGTNSFDTLDLILEEIFRIQVEASIEREAI